MSKNVEARLRIKNKTFEIIVDVEKALEMKKGTDVSIDNVLEVDEIFSDSKKGEKASSKDLTECFGTDDAREVAKKIIEKGDIQIPTELKNKEREERIKQAVDFLTKNCVDPATDRPYTSSRMQEVLGESGVNIENKPIESQLGKILEAIRKILPIKIETKKIKLTVPAIHTGKVYGVLKDYKEKEDWLGNGDLVCIVNIPAGMQMDFYDKINSLTHGTVLSEEIKNE
jgi:ribosome maturation protein SDO1